MNELGRLAAERRVIICAGPGGVGKTTMAAAIALHSARLGRRACVVTIDPAKRLADALGLESLTNEAHLVGREVDASEEWASGEWASGEWAEGGELWALMLDTKSTFDEVVRRNAATPEQAEAILDNRLYRNISGALGGTQEYMAMEKLYELYHSGQFDLVVVDTPPTRHALEFLDAPGRLLRFLNNRVFRLLMMPTRASLRAMGVATQMLLRAISKVVGGAIVSDAVDFFAAFEGMEQGFRDRAGRVEDLLVDPATAFVVVASPRRDAVDEALFFAERLKQSAGRVEALVVNRMFPYFGPAPAGAAVGAGGAVGAGDGEPAGAAGEAGSESPAGAAGGTPAGAPAEIAAMVANLVDLDRVAVREEQYVAALSERLAGVPVVRVPFLADDVHDVGGLDQVGRWLFDPVGPARPAGAARPGAAD